jgi:hypothetical protein
LGNNFSYTYIPSFQIGFSLNFYVIYNYVESIFIFELHNQVLYLAPRSYICTSGLPDFSWYNIPKPEKICRYIYKMYQMATKYTKCQQNIPNGNKIYQMAVNILNGHKMYQIAKIYQHFPFQDPRN